MSPSPHVACDPFDLYPLADPVELETLAVFAVAVAGRTPKVVWPKVVQLLAARGETSPYAYFRALGPAGLAARLRAVRMGQYTRIGWALEALARLPADWSWRDLLTCPGVSHKTAKLVQVYTHPGGRAVCLDRHVLRLLASHPLTRKKLGVVPEVSPSCPVRYAALEGPALLLADLYGLAGWEFDRVVWRAAYARQDPLAALEAAKR